MEFVVLKTPVEDGFEPTCYISGSVSTFIEACLWDLEKSGVEFTLFAEMRGVGDGRYAFGIRSNDIVSIGAILLESIRYGTYWARTVTPAFDDHGRVLSIVYFFTT